MPSDRGAFGIRPNVDEIASGSGRATRRVPLRLIADAARKSARWSYLGARTASRFDVLDCPAVRDYGHTRSTISAECQPGEGRFPVVDRSIRCLLSRS